MSLIPITLSPHYLIVSRIVVSVILLLLLLVIIVILILLVLVLNRRVLAQHAEGALVSGCCGGGGLLAACSSSGELFSLSGSSCASSSLISRSTEGVMTSWTGVRAPRSRALSRAAASSPLECGDEHFELRSAVASSRRFSFSCRSWLQRSRSAATLSASVDAFERRGWSGWVAVTASSVVVQRPLLSNLARRPRRRSLAKVATVKQQRSVHKRSVGCRARHWRTEGAR